jgi:lipopolysaccharide biosynthesis regulator YciM
MGASRIFATLKRVLSVAESEDPVYECRGCGEGYAVQYYCCPECGSYRVERAQWVLE